MLIFCGGTKVWVKYSEVFALQPQLVFTECRKNLILFCDFICFGIELHDEIMGNTQAH